MKLLIVDDSDAVRYRLCRMLCDIPELLVEEADSFGSGLARFESFAPDIVVLDIQLPDGSGLDFLHLAKRDNPPVVLMFTNHVLYKKRCMLEGADFFFDKSMDFENLIDVLRKITKERRGDETGCFE